MDEWDVQLSNRAERALERLPARDQARVEAALLDMKREPRAGDTRPLQGRHQGAFRRRVGSWRIIFALKSDLRVVLVADIRRRTTSTY
jgi:mRNA-degrading endonuclease RelE of RelBE toxin-antitoxin system